MIGCQIGAVRTKMNRERLLELAGVQLTEEAVETFTVTIQKRADLTSEEHKEIAAGIQTQLRDVLSITGISNSASDDKLGKKVTVR